jgi:hypothetical protein
VSAGSGGDDWRKLRESLEAAAAFLTREVPELAAILQLIDQTPACQPA